MAAVAVALAMVAVAVACGVLIVRLCLRLLARWWRHHLWDEFVACHRDLDGELEKVWQHR